nr:MAG TPA: terminase small subunit [Caudoviricetes sp.]
MPRPRKPLSEQKGNLTVEFQKQREFEESIVKTSRSELNAPPSWLINQTAKKEFRRICKLLEEIDIVGDLDLTNICGYCNAYAMYRQATEELLKDVKEKNSLKVTGGNGQETENPLVGIQRRYAQEMRDFEKLCGLTIDSRLKLASSKAKNIDDDIQDKFGDI